ncbi:hypothetical protein MRX96_003599 [Rhipicephalus microplus]
MEGDVLDTDTGREQDFTSHLSDSETRAPLDKSATQKPQLFAMRSPCSPVLEDMQIPVILVPNALQVKEQNKFTTAIKVLTGCAPKPNRGQDLWLKRYCQCRPPQTWTPRHDLSWRAKERLPRHSQYRPPKTSFQLHQTNFLRGLTDRRATANPALHRRFRGVAECNVDVKELGHSEQNLPYVTNYVYYH